MDLTLKNPSVFKEINGTFADFIVFFSMKNQLFPLKSPLAYTRILRCTPKMVFGHNLRYMAPFDFSRAGFCMVFRRASFVFSCPGRVWEAGVGFLDLGSTFWPGDQKGHKKWSRKKLFCGGMILWWGFKGIHPAQMNSMVPGTHMGRLLCPKTI